MSTHVDQVRAASAALRTRSDPFSTAVAGWLDTAARDMALDTARWPHNRPGDLDAFLENLYRHPLAVAGAVADEAAMWQRFGTGKQ
jgi:hypothetical protein